MATRKTTASKAATPAETEPDLLAGMEEPTQQNDDEELDMLSELSEDNGTAWKPADDDDVPRGIQGTVSFIGEVEKDAKFGGGFAPMIEVTTKDGTVWSVRGYHGVLDNKIQRMLDKGMKLGDLVALKYLGEKEGKNNTYQNYAGDYRAR